MDVGKHSLDQKILDSKATVKNHEKTVSPSLRILISNLPYMLKQTFLKTLSEVSLYVPLEDKR